MRLRVKAYTVKAAVAGAFPGEEPGQIVDFLKNSEGIDPNSVKLSEELDGSFWIRFNATKDHITSYNANGGFVYYDTRPALVLLQDNLGAFPWIHFPEKWLGVH